MTICSTNSSVATHTCSTASAPVPITSVVTTSNHDHNTESDYIVNELLDQVVAHAANSMLSAELKHSPSKRSQSFINLHQLEECEEEKVHLLKYPSAYSLNVTGIMEENADDVEKKLKDLISAASKVRANSSRKTVINDDRVNTTHSLTNFTKAATTSGVVTAPGDVEPVTSRTSLNAVSSSTLLNSNSSGSRSTQNFQDIPSIQDTSSMHMLHRAFSNLEHQLCQERKEALNDHRSIDKDTALIRKDHSKEYIKAFRDSIGLPAVYNVPKRSKEETDNLFEDILQGLEDNQSDDVMALPITLEHRRYSLDPSINLTSLASQNISDLATCRSFNPVISLDIPKSSDPHGLTTLCDPVTSHSLTTSYETVSSIAHQCTGSLYTEQDDLDHCRRSSMGTVTIPFDMAEDEPGGTALKQLVTMSCNEECLGHIVAHVCLPAFSSKLLQLSQWQCSSAGLLSNIAALLYNLFEVIIS